MPQMRTRVTAEEYREFLSLGHGEIFSLDIDRVVDAPWRIPGIDPSDFFNYGLNQRTWKEYTARIEKFRQEFTMQNRIQTLDQALPGRQEATGATRYPKSAPSAASSVAEAMYRASVTSERPARVTHGRSGSPWDHIIVLTDGLLPPDPAPTSVAVLSVYYWAELRHVTWSKPNQDSAAQTLSEDLVNELNAQREAFLAGVQNTTVQSNCKADNTSEYLPRLVEHGTWRSAHRRDAPSVTLVTQLSLDRLDMLDGQCATYAGVIAAALYVPLVRGEGVVSPAAKDYDGEPLAAASRALSDFHKAMEHTAACTLDLQLVGEEFDTRAEAGLYPFNAIRNRALMLAQTEASRGAIVLLLDVDFMPSFFLSEELHEQEQYTRLRERLRQGRVMVLPAFEMSRQEDGREVVHKLAQGGKPALAKAYTGGQVAGFQIKLWSRGHMVTDYTKWWTATEPYAGYEPYILVLREHVPWYDERFRGYGRDKIVHLMHLAALGMAFDVHPSQYVIHIPHPKAPTYRATKRSKQWDYLHNLFAEVQIDISTGNWTPVTSFADLCREVGARDSLKPVLARLSASIDDSI
ncbi:Glycosyltransferase-like protein LARGE1 [Auxenochlorella protothecoides]|uniref:Glycosyltransferase-like protein LARGE1 n=1 Tax=Auxenochlorella protothecoides TaxID=3075 RepID=A0A087SSJ3_AUXPR|nr:Glycosyltransferase-like protein LARGE1 [Auxenochlorella protothecoides]KFM28697.1 Glycosyltransferase-like protein LARGE1 [Auxenochlorella protothecoides]